MENTLSETTGVESMNMATKSKDDFYAVVSAIARFIETADDDASSGD
ncbi:MAG: hypothetical protein FWF79_05760 [Defluviitaleaceae bacterium]|nr:hypothetical protein [Defluviitaleaceae bacterium]